MNWFVIWRFFVYIDVSLIVSSNLRFFDGCPTVAGFDPLALSCRFRPGSCGRGGNELESVALEAVEDEPFDEGSCTDDVGTWILVTVMAEFFDMGRLLTAI